MFPNSMMASASVDPMNMVSIFSLIVPCLPAVDLHKYALLQSDVHLPYRTDDNVERTQVTLQNYFIFTNSFSQSKNEHPGLSYHPPECPFPIIPCSFAPLTSTFPSAYAPHVFRPIPPCAQLQIIVHYLEFASFHPPCSYFLQ